VHKIIQNLPFVTNGGDFDVSEESLASDSAGLFANFESTSLPSFVSMLPFIILASGWLLLIYGFLTGWISSDSDTAAGARLDSRLSSAGLVRGAVGGSVPCLVSEAVSSALLARGRFVDGTESDWLLSRCGMAGWMGSDGTECSSCCAGASSGDGTDALSNSSSVGLPAAAAAGCNGEEFSCILKCTAVH